MSWVNMATSEDNYKRQLSLPINGISKYASEMGGVVLRNCDDAGNILPFSSIKECKENNIIFWLRLNCLIFQENGSYFHIYAYEVCSNMNTMKNMKMEQSQVNLESMRCIHSKAAAFFFPTWRDHWQVEDRSLLNREICFTVPGDEGLSIETLSEERNFLACLRRNGKITLLFTVGVRQKFPVCDYVNCSFQSKCIHFHSYKKNVLKKMTMMTPLYTIGTGQTKGQPHHLSITMNTWKPSQHLLDLMKRRFGIQSIKMKAWNKNLNRDLKLIVT